VLTTLRKANSLHCSVRLRAQSALRNQQTPQQQARQQQLAIAVGIWRLKRLSHSQPKMLNRVLALVDLCRHNYFNATMRPPPRDRNAPTKYDDSQAKEDEAVKKTRLKTLKRRRTNAFSQSLWSLPRNLFSRPNKTYFQHFSLHF